MKIISLNTWGGEAGVPALLEFIRVHKEIDVFCLQEMWNGGEYMLQQEAGGAGLQKRATTLLADVRSTLPNFTQFYRPQFFDFFGIALFIRDEIEVIEEGEVFIYKEQGYISPEDSGDHARNLQYVTVRTAKGLLTVVHLHGLWNGKGKGDSDDRLEQSSRIVPFLEKIEHPYVLVGDFNLRPDTESLKMIEALGVRNLISEYGITSTRTSHYTKPEKFADYAFVSEGVTVNDFKVLPDEVSDHAPLYVDFSLS